LATNASPIVPTHTIPGAENWTSGSTPARPIIARITNTANQTTVTTPATPSSRTSPTPASVIGVTR